MQAPGGRRVRLQGLRLQCVNRSLEECALGAYLPALFPNRNGGIAMALWKDSNPAPGGGTSPNVSTPPPKDTFTAPADRTNVAPLNPQPAARKAAGNEGICDRLGPDHRGQDRRLRATCASPAGSRATSRWTATSRIDTGANLDGQVKAHVISVGGELRGNIENAKRVELLDGGVITGDVKAGSLTVAAGSRMRGQVEFGWEDEGKKCSRRHQGLRHRSMSAARPATRRARRGPVRIARRRSSKVRASARAASTICASIRRRRSSRPRAPRFASRGRSSIRRTKIRGNTASSSS